MREIYIFYLRENSDVTKRVEASCLEKAWECLSQYGAAATLPTSVKDWELEEGPREEVSDDY